MSVKYLENKDAKFYGSTSDVSSVISIINIL